MFICKKKKENCPSENKMCAFCENADNIGDSEICICKIYGIIRADGCCRRFKLDLLKVEPHAVKAVCSNNSFLEQYLSL